MIFGEQKWNIKQFSYQAFYLAFYAGYMPVLLFLPLFLKYYGLSTVQVGLLTGVRPLLQSIGTPILVKLGAMFRAKKLLFIVSCVLMTGKFFVIFIVLRPEKQLCRTTYSNGEVRDGYIHHKLSKRTDVMDEWLQALNYTASDVSFEYLNTNEVTKLQKASSAESPPTQDVFQIPNATRIPAAPRNPTGKTQYRVNHEHEVHFIFITLLLLALTSDYFDAAVFTLVDNAYRPIATYRGVWIWGDLTWGATALIIGVIMDQTAHEICGQMVGSFHYVFYFFVAFVSIALFIGISLDFSNNPYGNQPDLAKRIQTSKWNFQYNIFILAYTLVGFCNGFLFSFIYWFIDTLGGDAMIMGLSTSCECIVGLLIFFLLEHLLEYIGHMSAVCVGFVGYIAVFLSYYCIKNPWLVIAVKVLQATVSSIMIFTCNSFLKEAAPAGSSYQMQETLHSIYLAIGTAIGAVLSGFTLDNYRFPLTFLWFTLITCFISFLFLAIQLFVICTEGRSVSEIASESSSNESSEFGDDEEDLENGYEGPKW